MASKRRLSGFRRASRGQRATRLTATVLALCLVLACVQLLLGVSRDQNARDAAAATGAASNALLADLLDAETGQRGFLLTADATYLEPYHRATRAIAGDLDRLTRLEASKQATAPYVAGMRSLTYDKLSELNETIALAQSGDRPGALRIVDSGEGKKLMDTARREVHEAQAAADATAQAQRVAARRLMLGTLLGVALLALFLLLLLVRNRRWRQMSARREENFQRVFDEAPIGMAIFPAIGRPGGCLTQANRELSRVTGFSADQLLGMHILELTHPADREVVRANLARLESGSVSAATAERRWLHADGSELWVAASVSVLHEPSGEAKCVIQVLDITARKHAEQHLTRQAFYDSLTDLPNRSLMQDHLVQALLRAQRQDRGVALLYIDLDDFKNINDVHGHSVGDAVLIEAARRLKTCLRGSDTAARMGGDEFVVVCEDVLSEDDIGMLAKRITDTLGQPLEIAGQQIQLSASTGVTFSRGDADPEDLVREADAAMYSAKRGGKAHHALADVAIVARAQRHLALDQELHAAVERDELRLHYQPVIDLRTRKVVSVEALLRWQHPDRGLLHPADFLDVAEESRHIVPIGEWVLRTACAQVAAWSEMFGDAVPTMAINVASAQLASHDFSDHVLSALRDSGLAPQQLILEITERQILSAANSAQEDLARLAAADVQLSVDDFGTGYSTFDYLRRFDFDILKIDQSFVSGLGTDTTDTAIVSALLTLSDSLDLTVIAEGVENERQLLKLDSLGCRFVQGFHLHRPVVPAAIEELVRSTAPGPSTLALPSRPAVITLA